jgi:hypothetical protein
MEKNEILNEDKKIKHKFFNNNIFEKLRNFIGMIISFSENNYQMHLNPSDFIIKFEKKSGYNNRNNYFKIFNISLNSKNISSQNIKKSIEKIISDRENYFDLDLSERFFKNQIFNFQEFIFKKEVNNELIDYKIPDNKNNILIYVLRNNRDNNRISNNLDYIIKNNESFFYFEKVYIIKCYKQNNNEDQINLTNNSNNLIEFLIFQDNKNSHKNIFINNTNIFDSEMFGVYNYFLICNNEKKIIKINNYICNNEDFKLKLKHIFEENKNTKKNELEELNSIINKLISKNMNYYTNFKISMECYYKFNDSLTILNLYKIKNLKLNGSLRSNHCNLIKNKIDKLNYKPNKINSNLTEIETFNLLDIDFNQQILCKNCGEVINTKLSEKNNEINTKGFYYCFWCKDFYCIKCVEEKLSINCTTNYQQKLIDKNHNLLYFCTTEKEDLKEFDKMKLGINHYNPETLNELVSRNENHSYMCNGCHGNGENCKIKARYVCVSCRPGIYRSGGYVDYCFNCIEHLRNEDDIGKEIEKIEDEYYPKTHSHKHHVYFCVVFQIDNYQNY